MTKLQRSAIVVGRLRVECAVRADGTSPAREFLDYLREGMWTDDPESQDLPDEEQVRDYHLLLDKIRTFARDGVPGAKGDINYLHHGLWEFRVGRKRLVFYDTPGDGTYVAKPKFMDRAEADYPDDDWFWWVPDFDKTIRLANYWPKMSEKADPADIELARQIREEDVAHDRIDRK